MNSCIRKREASVEPHFWAGFLMFISDFPMDFPLIVIHPILTLKLNDGRFLSQGGRSLPETITVLAALNPRRKRPQAKLLFFLTNKWFFLLSDYSVFKTGPFHFETWLGWRISLWQAAMTTGLVYGTGAEDRTPVTV